MDAAGTATQSDIVGSQVMLVQRWAHLLEMLRTDAIARKEKNLERFELDSMLPHIRPLLVNIEKLRTNLHSLACDDPPAYMHLAFTLMAPAGRADRAALGLEALHKIGFFKQEMREACANKYSSTRRLVESTIRPYVRFPHQKAVRLVEAIPIFRKFHHQLAPSEPRRTLADLHDWLLTNIKGLGPKATAHLMRNLGLFYDYEAYPIIDVHIYKALAACNFKAASYKEAERSFCRLAELTMIPIIPLDALIWCTYSGNWTPDTSDFGNFKHLQTTTQEIEHDRTSNNNEYRRADELAAARN